MSLVSINRDAEGVFTARLGTLTLHSGKGQAAINHCYDIKDALDGYALSRPIGVSTEVAQPSGVRKFFVQVNGVKLVYSSNAKRVYDFADTLNRLMGLTRDPDLATRLAEIEGETLPHQQPEDGTPHDLQG